MAATAIAKAEEAKIAAASPSCAQWSSLGRR
jgi:hypothetical protein